MIELDLPWQIYYDCWLAKELRVAESGFCHLGDSYSCKFVYSFHSCSRDSVKSVALV